MQWVKTFERLKAKGNPFVVATVANTDGSTPREIGARIFISSSEEFEGTIGGGHLELKVLEDANEHLRAESGGLKRYPLGSSLGQCCGGSVDIFYEFVPPSPRLYLFGAGHVGQALCRVLSNTPFVVHLTDDRKEWIESKEIPPDVLRHHEEWHTVVDSVAWNEHCYVAIMTYGHPLDEEILRAVLSKPCRYVGLIGSEAKWKRFHDRLKRHFSTDTLSRVQCPMGVGIGGKSPQEVAISIAAELLQIHHAHRQLECKLNRDAPPARL